MIELANDLSLWENTQKMGIYRKCVECKRNLPLNRDNFPITYFKSDTGFRDTCIECRYKGNHRWEETEKSGIYKKCTTCFEFLPLNMNHFARDKYNNTTGFRNDCKDCRAKTIASVGSHSYKLMRQLPPEDEARMYEDGIHVLCHYHDCRSRFLATRAQLKHRISCIERPEEGSSFFFCSDECKMLCTDFGFNINGIYPLSDLFVEKDEKEKARAASKQSKIAIMANQMDKDGYNHCERCGKVHDPENHHPMELHHIDEVGRCGCKAVRSDGHILFCYECHKGQQKGIYFT